jgi:hypothetical protein
MHLCPLFLTNPQAPNGALGASKKYSTSASALDLVWNLGAGRGARWWRLPSTFIHVTLSGVSACLRYGVVMGNGFGLRFVPVVDGCRESDGLDRDGFADPKG